MKKKSLRSKKINRTKLLYFFGILGFSTLSILLSFLIPSTNFDNRNQAYVTSEAQTCSEIQFVDMFERRNISRQYWRAEGPIQTEFLNNKLRILLSGTGQNRSGALVANKMVSGQFQTNLWVTSYEILNNTSGNGTLGIQIETPNEKILFAVRAGRNPAVITRRTMTNLGTPAPVSGPNMKSEMQVNTQELERIGFSRVSNEEFEAKANALSGKILFTISRDSNNNAYLKMYTPQHGTHLMATFPEVKGDARVRIVSNINENVTNGRSRARLHLWGIDCYESVPSPTPITITPSPGPWTPTPSPVTPTPRPWTPTPSPFPNTPTPSPWTPTPMPTPIIWPRE